MTATATGVGISFAVPTARLCVTSASAGDGFLVSGSGTNSPQFSLYSSTTQYAAFGLALNNTHFSANAVANDLIIRTLGMSTGGSIRFSGQTANSNFYWETGTSPTAKMIMNNDGTVALGPGHVPTAVVRLSVKGIGTASSG